jgi:hypothetical protein
MQADRITLKGRVCAQDTAAERLPLRVVLVVDQAAGPLYASYDPGAVRIQYLRDIVQTGLVSEQTEFAVVGFGGRSRTLAPSEGSFTRNPGELLSALNQLAISEPCVGTDVCRNYLEGLRTARSVIEGDLAQTPAGTRVITQYLVVLLLAGPQQPLATNRDCCEIEDSACQRQELQASAACQSQRELQEVDALLSIVLSEGGLGVRLHVLHLSAETAAVNEQLQKQLRDLAFEGLGSYTQIASPEVLSVSGADLLEQRTDLRVKTLVVANLNARPTASGPEVDTDADGLADEQERVLGSDETSADTDGDGIGDLAETLAGLNPLKKDQPNACRPLKKPGQDSDLDGLSDCDEALLGTEPSLVDSDGDGMPDMLEVAGPTDFLQPDAESDDDGDGVTNGDELSGHTDPRSDDSSARRLYRYRYEISDEGVVKELYALPMTELTGVEFSAMTAGTTPGLGVLRYRTRPKTISWQDGKDERAGETVAITKSGPYELPSSSWAPVQGEDGRKVTVTIQIEDLPTVDVTERVRLIYRSRQCLAYTVRNIRLMDTRRTVSSEAGLNRIALYFAEAPEGAWQRPGPFRLAEVPVVYKPPNRRTPASPAVTVFDEEFVTVGGP